LKSPYRLKDQMNGSPVVESTSERRVEELQTTTKKMLEKAMESLELYKQHIED